MTAHTSLMGIEIAARETEIVADYTDGSGRYVQFLMPHPVAGNLAVLLTAQSTDDGDAFAQILVRAEKLDGTLPADYMITDRFGSTPDLPAGYVDAGFTDHVVIDGRSYLSSWADEAVICSVEFPKAV